MGNKNKQKTPSYPYSKNKGNEVKSENIVKTKKNMNILNKDEVMKIVYLTPKATFRTLMRSDTLWGNICWAIRMVYGNDKLEEFIEKEPFIISSTFPFLVDANNEKIPFFPKPFVWEEKSPISNNLSFKDKLLEMTKQKKQKKAITWLSKINFEKVINGENIIKDDNLTFPKQNSVAITRNKIDRIKGGTLKVNDVGQLFHVEEFYFEQENTGLFFLAKGNDFSLLSGALRYLNHVGIGGDRSIGKGSFEISELQDFYLKMSKTSKFVTNLSLYYPTDDEFESFIDKDFTYQLEDRKGKLGFLNFQNVEKDALLFFKESSIFPNNSSIYYGKNIETNVSKINNLSHKVYHYGKGFMLNIDLKQK